ncbi:MAG: histidine phosphatase family protein [Saprospiraceae bacterium]|nr:histidine phosphatase family protein [Saprospiraceae bacterium]
MKILSALILISGLLILGACKPATTIYLVRHAEKVDSSRDPDLSEAGRLRATHLADLLKDEKISLIYSTNYKRTIQTATPLSELTGKPILYYSPDTLPSLVKALKQQQQHVLVVGHSNTTISMLDAFGLSFSGKKIEESDYNNLFKISTYPNNGKIKFKELKF